jgi:polyphosphate glucokinase
VAIGNDADVAGLAEMRFGAGRGQRGTVMVLTIGTGMGTAVFIDGRLFPNTELGHLEMNGRDAEERVAESARARFDLSWRDWASAFDDSSGRTSSSWAAAAPNGPTTTCNT